MYAHSNAEAQAVIKSFNTWRFKREQPSCPDLLEAFVSRAVARGAPIPFVLYWGKGLRCSAGVNERRCLAYLGDMARRIEAIHAGGARFQILYTDTHARLNGHGEDSIASYEDSVTSELDRSLFDIRRLSAVCAQAAVLPADLAAAPRVDKTAMVAKLAGCAEKWYRGGGCASDGAARYFDLNMVERLAVERVFPDSIFVTFNGSELRNIFPVGLPIFYMYSVKKGTSTKPWFMDDPATGGRDREMRASSNSHLAV